MKIITIISTCLIPVALIGLGCSQNASSGEPVNNEDTAAVALNNYGGYASQVEWGQHLVLIGGCNDCHTPKKMTNMGPVADTSLLLSGHPAHLPAPEVNRKEMESKGLAVTSDLTAWVGPWGISYAANLTPDKSGLGNWTPEQFLRCIRQGNFKGLESSRQLLPPMPWKEIGAMTDDELKAIFAYLQSIKPIANEVPAALPPALAASGH